MYIFVTIEQEGGNDDNNENVGDGDGNDVVEGIECRQETDHNASKIT